MGLVVQALVTAIGFQPHLVTKPREIIDAEIVFGIATPHPRSQETAKQLQAIAQTEGWSLQIIDVGDAFDLAGWYRAWHEACQLAGNDAAMNFTAGHGISTSAAAIIAFQTGIEAILYDDIKDESHRFTPRQLAYAPDLDDVESKLVALLRKQPLSVGDLAEQAHLGISHASRAISRLKAKGFIRQERVGNYKINHLRPGLPIASVVP